MAGGSPWVRGAWATVFALEVATKLRPFPSHSWWFQPLYWEMTGSHARATQPPPWGPGPEGEMLWASRLQNAAADKGPPVPYRVHHSIPGPCLALVAWRWGHSTAPPSDAAAGPHIVRRFLPLVQRPHGRQHREEDKQQLIWVPQAASLFPSTPALTALGMAVRPLALTGRERAARYMSGSIPWGCRAGPGGCGQARPQCRAGMPAEGMRSSGASRAPSVPGEGIGLQHYVRIR